VKRRDLERHLRSHGARLLRKGGDGKIVETGSVGQVYANPAHEYTRALLAAVPVPDPQRMRERRAQRRREGSTPGSRAMHDGTAANREEP
jgi:oligopeptide/dipeptide ABC transporter ATP-binding protein